MAKQPENVSPFHHAPLPTARLSADERLACLRLIRSENVGAVAFRDLINRYGGATRALDAIPEISRRAGRRSPICVCPKEQAEAELEAAHAAGAQAVFTIEPGYPAALAVIDGPPPVLYIKGRSSLLEKPAIAIVGSRLCSATGPRLQGCSRTRSGRPAISSSRDLRAASMGPRTALRSQPEQRRSSLAASIPSIRPNMRTCSARSASADVSFPKDRPGSKRGARTSRAEIALSQACRSALLSSKRQRGPERW